MKSIKKIFFEELLILFEKNEVISSLEYEISEIEEYFGEYCLSLRCDNFEIKGIFSKFEEKLKVGQIIICRFSLLKTQEHIKIITKYFIRKELNNINQGSKRNIKYIYNFNPEFFQST